MFLKTIKTVCRLALVALMAGGCQKYAPLEPIPSAAYLRVLNSITNYDVKDFSHVNLAATRTLTLLIDPVSGGTGIPKSAATVGDFIYFRSFYAAPYETIPDQQYVNTEYPGAYTVRVGGVVNGLDLSRWAQVPSGKHRVMILRRSIAIDDVRTYFDDVPSGGRDSVFRVALDTTMNFSEKGIYTVEVQSLDPLDATKLAWYVRQESFATQSFDSSKVYVNFYNMLTAPTMPAALDVYVHLRYVDNCVGPLQTKGFLPPSPLPWTFSFDPYNSGLFYVPYNTPESLLTKVTGKFATESPYVALPMPATDSFYYHEGPAFGQYRLPFDRPKYILDFYLPGRNAASGATPFLELECDEFNSYALTNVSMDLKSQYWGMTAAPKQTTPYMYNLYQTVTVNNVARAFPMVNTIELLNTYDALNSPTANVKAFQISLQRPYEASFIQ